MRTKPIVSEKMVERLSLYRRLLSDLRDNGREHVFSHDLAALVGGTAAQVRRDIMTIGFSGSPSKGYLVAPLIDSIDDYLDAPGGTRVALVGVGNLGRALLTFFLGRRPKLSIVAAFDRDPERVNRVTCGCRCHPMNAMPAVIAERDARVAILTVPADQAQAVTDELVRAGVEGILNFAPVPLRVPPGVFVEEIDITSSLEKVAYFARQG